MWATTASVTKTNLCEWLRQDGSLPQSVVPYRDRSSLAKKPNFLLHKGNRLTWLLLLPVSARLHFVVLRLMYVIDIEKLNAVSCCLAGSKKLPSSLSHGQGLLF